MKKWQSLKQVGFTLLELLLVLTIIALMAVLGLRYYKLTDDARKIDETVYLVNSIAAAAQNWKAGQSSYESISLKSLKDLGLLPANVDSPWGSGSKLDITGEAQGKQFKITLDQLASEACQNLAAKFSVTNQKPKDDACSGQGSAVTFTFLGN